MLRLFASKSAPVSVKSRGAAWPLKGRSLTRKFGFDISRRDWGGGGLPNKGRYRCAASAKPRAGKISPKNLMPGQKSDQKPNDRASFHDF